MNKVLDFLQTLFGEPRLPKAFRQTLEKFEHQPITGIEVVREPLSGVAEGLMKLITAGKWTEIRKNFDKIYHLYAILSTPKGKLLLEKNQTPVLSTHLPTRGKEAESIDIIPDHKITVGEMVAKTIKRVGIESYTRYDAFQSNCQVFIKNNLLYNDLYTPEAVNFIYQDTRELIEKTPRFSKWLGKALTDIAGTAEKLIQEVVYKRGGRRLKKRIIGV